MNFSIKPHPFFAHWVPGCVLVALGLFSIKGWHWHSVTAVFGSNAGEGAAALFFLSIAALVIGEILDTFRDVVIEGCIMDHCLKPDIKWDFFFWADANTLNNMIDSYYTYYVFSVNLFLAMFVFLVLGSGACFFPKVFGWIKPLPDWPCAPNVFASVSYLAVLVLLARGAWELRNDIKRHTNDWVKNSPPKVLEGKNCEWVKNNPPKVLEGKK